MLINDCGTCEDQPCCDVQEQDPCGYCPKEMGRTSNTCDPSKIMKIVTGQTQDLLCNRTFVEIQIDCPEPECFTSKENIECHLNYDYVII